MTKPEQKEQTANRNENDMVNKLKQIQYDYQSKGIYKLNDNDIKNINCHNNNDNTVNKALQQKAKNYNDLMALGRKTR